MNIPAHSDQTLPAQRRLSTSSAALVKRLLRDLDDEGPFNADWASEREQPAALLAAADEMRAMMAPAPPALVEEALRALRSATILRQEDAAEATASFDLLCAHLSDVPADILLKGCGLYVNTPGKRFFPRSAGEIRAFTSPMVMRRQVREYRLRAMARAAEERERRGRRTAAEPLTLDEIRRLPKVAAQAALNQGWISQSDFDAAFPAQPAGDAAAP
ncbi:hypothetical protein EIK56_23105 [Sphingomonas sp. C8-2]|nr:hypothetical protein EIK56_23105 [Sphingomonas sp. C8-2]